MKKSDVFYSIWEIFSYHQQKKLENLKKNINKYLRGPLFPIHLTISAGFVGKEKELINKMQLILYQLEQFYIELDNYGYKDAFFKSLYIKVKKSNELILQKKIIDNTFNSSTKFFLPHISLFYGNASKSLKNKIILNLPDTKQIIKIKNLCLAINDEKKLKWEIIEKFKISTNN